MGNCNFKTAKDKETSAPTSKAQFNQVYAVGRGGFGKVWRVQSKKDKNDEFAMKEMAKARIITKKSVPSVMNELKLLSMISTHFIVNVHYAFQDQMNLYLIMDLLLGGDLRYHIARKRKFSMDVTRFFIACLVHALDAVHAQLIIHRDIKPENLVFDNEGYLRLTDFGVARILSPDNASETSGTPGYMAPEVMCRQNHGLAADYFAVGVIAYECMMGERPYKGRTRKDIRDQILCRQVQIKKYGIPEGWDEKAADFINKCLQRKPINRIGNTKGIRELKSHPWFEDFNWADLASRKMQSPYVPDINVDNFDTNHVNNQEWKDAEAVRESETQLRRNSVQELFKGYYYNKSDMQSSQPEPAQNQSSQILLSGHTTTKMTTQGGVDKDESPIPHKSRGRQSMEQEIEEEV